jgi:hypothetical protein
MPDNARMRAIAARFREGRVIRQIRRAMIAASGRPLFTRELIEWCYPGRERQHWHYWSVYRAVKRYGIRIGRGWAPNADLRRLIDGG